MFVKKKIAEIAEFIKTGKTPPTGETKYFNGDINWYTPGDLDKSKKLGSSIRKLSDLAIEENKASVFPENTLLVGCIGDIGKLGITSDKCSSNQQITGIFPKQGVDVNYLYYWFLDNKKVLESYSNNAVVPILNNAILSTIQIPLPPLATQQKIAAILDAADAYRQLTKTLIAKYDQLAQSLFLDMFGDPVRNEKGWDFLKLGQLGEWSSGGTPSRKVDEYYNGKIPWLSSGELGATYISESSEHITEKAIRESATKLIKPESLLLGMYDTAALKSSITTDELTCNQAIAFSLLNCELVNTLFIFLLIQYGKEHFRRLQRGVRQKNLNLSMIKDIQVFCPPIALQNQFAERIQLLEAQKQQAQSCLQKAEELFNSLLQKAFKGELVS